MNALRHTKKELANDLQRSPRFIRDMERGGFRLPATAREAVEYLRAHPHPTRNRQRPEPRRRSCRSGH